MPRTLALARPDAAECAHLQCSFCGRSGRESRFLSAGVFGGTICDRCGFVALGIFVGAYLGTALRIAGRAFRR